MGTVVNETCGLKIPLRSPEDSVSGFAKCIESIAVTPEKLEELSRGALKRAREMTWKARTKKISNAYKETLDV